MTVMPLSFSRLNTFEQCQAKFDYMYVTKSVKDQGSSASEYGNRVHEALELHGRAAAAKDPGIAARLALDTTPERAQTLKQWGPLVERIAARPGTKLFEHQMAVNKDLQPVDWFAKDVWIRSIADVLIVDGDKAVCIDWKTGKVKDDPSQLQLFAAMVMWQYPEVQKVTTSFIWLAYNQTTDATYDRRYLGALWNALKPRFDRVQEVIELGVFKAKPSPLCNWCAAKTICPDARTR